MAQDSVNTPDPHATPNTHGLRNQGGEHGARAKRDQGNLSSTRHRSSRSTFFFKNNFDAVYAEFL